MIRTGLVLVLLVAGCAGPRQTTRQALERPLAAVNQDLDGQMARIELADGTTIGRAERVRIDSTVTRYRGNRMGETVSRSVPTADVARIVIVRGRSNGVAGALLGAAPGVLLAVGSSFASPDSGSPGESLEAAGTQVLGVAVGVVAAVVGGVVGATTQVGRSPGHEVVVYQRPGGPTFVPPGSQTFPGR